MKMFLICILDNKPPNKRRSIFTFIKILDILLYLLLCFLFENNSKKSMTTVLLRKRSDRYNFFLIDLC